MTPDDHPISCDVHDVLEALASRRQVADVRFRGADSAVQHRRTVITDLFARDGAEYMVLGSGETVRLDQLVAVDDAKLACSTPVSPGNGRRSV